MRDKIRDPFQILFLVLSFTLDRYLIAGRNRKRQKTHQALAVHLMFSMDDHNMGTAPVRFLLFRTIVLQTIKIPLFICMLTAKVYHNGAHLYAPR